MSEDLCAALRDMNRELEREIRNLKHSRAQARGDRDKWRRKHEALEAELAAMRGFSWTRLPWKGYVS